MNHIYLSLGGMKLKAANMRCSILHEVFNTKKKRDVTVKDLLRRDEINLSLDEVSGYLNGETILVTGGGGSIGSEICRQIAQYSPRTLLIYDIYENNAYDIQMELLQKYKNNLDIKVIIGSIQDKKRVDYVFSLYKPGIVFHAAAHKHVPLMEENPQEALKNNVWGTLNVAECANFHRSKKFVLISTDKAVNPTSIMGATKRIAELIIQYMNGISQTRYCAVRFGNVLGSNGSVIPLFKKQIEYGGPITITHQDVTRYFMTIWEAASLVIQSAAMMSVSGGEIFILDMGKPLKIIEIAKSLVAQYGLKLEKDIKIEYIGLRPGEKLNEELLLLEDGIIITKNDKIFIEKTKDIDLNSYMKEMNGFRFNPLEASEEAVDFIKKLMPSYQPLINEKNGD